MIDQLIYFANDYKKAVGRRKLRGLYLWLSWGIIGVFCYRLERMLYLKFKGGYLFIRVALYPLLSLVQALSHLEIDYHADIGPGMKILHSSMGVVVNGKCKAGKNLTFVGGNVIGLSRSAESRDFIIGDNVTLGANACIIGPVKLGNNINIGALACVVKDANSDTTLVGVPAKEIKKHVSSNIK